MSQYLLTKHEEVDGLRGLSSRRGFITLTGNMGSDVSALEKMDLSIDISGAVLVALPDQIREMLYHMVRLGHADDNETALLRLVEGLT